MVSAIVVMAALVIAGCSSTSSTTYGYVAPSITSITAKKKEASKAVSTARKKLRTAQRKLDKLQRQIVRDERRLKRKKLSKRTRVRLESNVAKRKKAVRTAKRDVRNATRVYNRSVRVERRATRSLETAQRRKKATDRRRAAAERSKADLQARQSANSGTARQSSTSAFVGGLFGFGRSRSGGVNLNDYKARTDNGFRLAAIPVNKMDKRLLRQQVNYRTRHKVGTIIVDPRSKYLYLVQPGGKAMRYGIGVGKAGFEWSGSAHIGWKQKWPKWTPPAEMIARRPSLAKWGVKNGGMPGGTSNPLGARALYLMQGGKDTLYRLHGTPEWNSIGTAASSGCIRLMNQDVIDLYNRVPNGAKVIVLS
ncbi:MAG: L,D-transpeptidase family protein [Rhizobiaceae bacterium]